MEYINTKIANVRQNFSAMQGRLSCPLCHQPLQIQNNSFSCSQGHCFDLSAQNYLNLAPQKKQNTNLYTTELFKARRQIFEAGLYDPLLENLLSHSKASLQASNSKQPILLDAGCGEGFFASKLHQQINGLTVCALDLAKNAVQLATKGPVCPGFYCVIGDLANLPLLDNSIDILLNLLSPANYQEFARVLKPGGLLIKVIPGSEYLKEVRQALQIQAPERAERQALDLWQQHISPLQTQIHKLTYQKAVTPEQAAAFVQMSPLSFNHQPSAVKADFSQITIDLRILIATR